MSDQEFNFEKLTDIINPIPMSFMQKKPKNNITNIFKKLEDDFKKGRFSWVGPFNEFALGYITHASILHCDRR